MVQTLNFLCCIVAGSISQQQQLAPSALAGVGLSLNPEGKEKGSWWHSTAELVLIARDAIIL